MAHSINLVERAKSVVVSPDSAWAAIATERHEAASLITGYVLPLAGAAAVAQAIGVSVVGQNFGLLGTYRMPLTSALGMAVASLVFAAVGVLVMSFIIDALAPTFGAERSREQALKVAVYSATPVWLAGLLQIVPVLGVLALIGALYALYLLYLGLPRLMKSPPDKTLGYFGAVIVCAIVVGLIGSALVAQFGVYPAVAPPSL
jgi:Yip1-like protein